MLVGTDDCVRVVFLWEETGVPWETHLPNLVTTWPSHLQLRVSNSGCSGERRALYHWGSRAPYSVDLVTVFELFFIITVHNVLYLLAISFIGQELLQKLQHYSDIAMQGQESVTTLDNLEAQKQVKRMLQYLESRVDKVAAYLENRDRSLNMDVQRDTVQREIRQVTCVLGGRPLQMSRPKCERVTICFFIKYYLEPACFHS